MGTRLKTEIPGPRSRTLIAGRYLSLGKVFHDLFPLGRLRETPRVSCRRWHRILLWQTCSPDCYPAVGNVRSLGTMMGFELVKNLATKEPWPKEAKQLTKFCDEHGRDTLCPQARA